MQFSPEAYIEAQLGHGNIRSSVDESQSRGLYNVLRGHFMVKVTLQHYNGLAMAVSFQSGLSRKVVQRNFADFLDLLQLCFVCAVVVAQAYGDRRLM